MELKSIHLARVAALLEFQSLDPKGSKTPPEGLNSLAERYNFFKSPSTMDELDFQKGVEFVAGRSGAIAIDRMFLYASGIVIDTRSSTDDSLSVLRDLLDHARANAGAVISPERLNFVSQIVFRSDLKLSSLNPILQPIADRLTERVSINMKHPIRYEPTAFVINTDLSQLKVTPSLFSLERRTEAPFSENIYFSSAPLSTTEHLNFLEEIEAALQGG